MKRLGTLLIMVLALFAHPLLAEEEALYEEGVHYSLVPNPTPGGNDGQVIVTEVFWYACGACYRFEPILVKWLDEQPAYIDFIYAPAVFSNETTQLHAKARAIAEVLDVADELHHKLYLTIHKDKKPLNTEAKIEKFFIAHGVSKEEFSKAAHSFAAIARYTRFKELSKRYMVTKTPTLIVNGKYKINSGSVASFEEQLQIVDYLVAKERAKAE